MLKLPSRTTLLAGLFALGLALVPTYSQALPGLCEIKCRCSSSCNQLCSATNGGFSVTTCAAWGICQAQCRVTPPKSAFEQAVLEAEDDAGTTARAESESKLEQAGEATRVFLGE